MAEKIKRNVSLDSQTVETIEVYNDEERLDNFSLALRKIVAEWSEQRKINASIDRQYARIHRQLSPEPEFPRGNDQGAPEPAGQGASNA